MREIKFRAWDVERESMELDDQVVKLWLARSADPECTDGEAVFMQYTGLKDMNGVEIYEGDIVRHGIGYRGANARKYPGLVIWDNELLHFRIKEFDTIGGVAWSNYGSELWCEVIGNIYENPDLLK